MTKLFCNIKCVKKEQFCLENRYEKEPYYIVVDMQDYKAVKEIEALEDRYVFVPVELLKYYGLTDAYNNCAYALEKYFDTEFEMNMVYDFEIYE